MSRFIPGQLANQEIQHEQSWCNTGILLFLLNKFAFIAAQFHDYEQVTMLQAPKIR